MLCTRSYSLPAFPCHGFVIHILCKSMTFTRKYYSIKISVNKGNFACKVLPVEIKSKDWSRVTFLSELLYCTGLYYSDLWNNTAPLFLCIILKAKPKSHFEAFIHKEGIRLHLLKIKGDIPYLSKA